MDDDDVSVFKARRRFSMENGDQFVQATGMLFWIWIVLTATVVLKDEPDLFSRFGSIGVLYVGLHYGIYRSITDDAEMMVFEIETIGRIIHIWGATTALAANKTHEAIALLKSYEETVDEEGHELVSRQKGENQKREPLVFVIATLQWGFGDLFHCWVNGRGWQVCY